jgi:hypothetical protein
MLTPIDPLFLDESARFALRFSCQDCVHHEARTLSCSLSYPNDVHLDSNLEARSSLLFCKAFELG